MIEAKVFWTFVRIYSVFRSARLGANIKLTLHKTLIRSVMTYPCSAWELAAGTWSAYKTRVSAHWKFSKVHIGPRFAHSMQSSVCTRSHNKQKSCNFVRLNFFALQDKAAPDVENRRGLNLAAVKHTTVHVTKLPLYHKLNKIGMICFAKPGLTKDLYVLQKVTLFH
jgi:hypothetical protein